MRIASQMTALALSISLAPPIAAQTVDVGRGEVPVQVPASYSPDVPAPLVILLHGYGSNGERQAAYMRLPELVDSHGFVLVHPTGTREQSERQRTFWNASKACCNFMGSTVDDSGYVLQLIGAVRSRYSIDPDRIYLVGHSNGGFMSYRVAREHSGTIAAIVSLAGAAATDVGSPPAAPVHVLQIHGTDDDTIEYDGGDIGGTVYPSAIESVERWARFNGCSVENPTVGESLDLDSSIDGAETTVMRYEQGCRPGGSSELWTIQDGSHIPSLSDSFNAAVIEWLMAHPKR